MRILPKKAVDKSKADIKNNQEVVAGESSRLAKSCSKSQSMSWINNSRKKKKKKSWDLDKDASAL